MKPRRRQRIERLIEEELGCDIQKYVFELAGKIVTIKGVRISLDLSQADVYVTSLEDKEETIRILNKKASYLRSLLARRLNLRYTPKLRFLKDVKEERERQIEKLFEKLKNEKGNS